MQQERVVLFLDFANINRTAREKGVRLDYQHLLHYVGENRFLVDSYCYVPIDPRNEHRLDRDIEELWNAGYIVTTKKGSVAGSTYKCNFDVEITMDMLKSVYQIKPDIIVLASGDSDFVPLIHEVRKSGVRVEVAAFEESTGPDILLKSSGFIDIAVYYEDYLTALQLQHEQGDEVEDQYRRLIREQNEKQDEQSMDAIQKKLQAEQNALDEEDDDEDDELENENDEKKGHGPVEKIKDEAQVAPSDIADSTDSIGSVSSVSSISSVNPTNTIDISAIVDGSEL